MIDISSLPEHELAGLEGFEAKELYKVVRDVWSNHVEEGSAVSGVFLDYETAKSFVKAMADREERLAKEDNEVFDYEIFWDQLDGLTSLLIWNAVMSFVFITPLRKFLFGISHDGF